MQLAEYLSQPDVSKVDFARRLGVVRQYVHKIATGLQLPSPALARAIEEATGGAVTKAELRPDIWDAPVTTGPAAHPSDDRNAGSEGGAQ